MKKLQILLIMIIVLLGVVFSFPNTAESSRIRLHTSTLEEALADGELFSATHFEADLADTAELDIRITTAASPTVTLVAVIIEGIGDGDIELFENGTISVGTGITPLDLNRQTANVSVTVFADGPTVTSAGTSIFKGAMVGGTKNDGIPAAFVGQAALVLKLSEDYLLRITNESGTASNYSVRFVFKEG